MPTSPGVEQISLYDLASFCGKTSPAPSPAGSRKARISALCWRKRAALSAVAYQSLDLTPGHGDLLGRLYWETLSPWRGGCSMRNTGVSPSDARVSSLSQILQARPPRKYFLSRKACQGILRRARERGKTLPPQLDQALRRQAGELPQTDGTAAPPLAFHINQRDEAIDLGETAGAIMATQNMQMQTFVSQPDDGQQTCIAAFNAGAGASAGTIGYGENCAPTLKAARSGNMAPAVLLHGQEDEETPPRVYENHGADGRFNGPKTVTPTLAANCGAGGNNLPLVETAANTLFSRQRVDVFCEDDTASTQSARQCKDATDLVCQENTDTQSANLPDTSADKTPLRIRRLTPLECERLQGFPDGWTDLPGAADTARYKALGNSVAIPCVEYLLHGVALALDSTAE